MKILLPLLALVGLLVAACGGQPASPATTTVTVTLTDTTIALSESSVPTGRVTFEIVNKGTTVHSLVVLKTDLPHDRIPADPADASKVEEKGSLLSTGQLAVGTTRRFSRELATGSYVLVCNEPAHYIVGMHIGFVVR